MQQPQQQQQPFSIPIKVDQPKQPQQQQQNGQQLPHPPKRPSVMERLRALEMEMSVEAAGLRLPEDPELTDKLSAFLGAQHPDADLQITVSSVRRTTTTKQQYETETPGMVGLPVDKLMDLQRKLMEKISANKLAEEANAAEKQQKEQKEEEEEWARRGHPDVQRSETVEESFPVDEGGTQMITKKRTHVVTMSQSRIQGLDDLPMGTSAADGKTIHGIQVASTGPPPQKEGGFQQQISYGYSPFSTTTAKTTVPNIGAEKSIPIQRI